MLKTAQHETDGSATRKRSNSSSAVSKRSQAAKVVDLAHATWCVMILHSCYSSKHKLLCEATVAQLTLAGAPLDELAQLWHLCDLTENLPPGKAVP